MANLNDLLPDDFDAENYKGDVPIPKGWYLGVIKKSETVPTKNGDGTLVKLQCQLMDDDRNGEYNGRWVFDQICFKPSSIKSMQFSTNKMASLSKAVGVNKPQDTSELHNVPVMIHVGIAEDQNGDPRNEVKGYKPFERSGAQQADKNTRPYGGSGQAL